MNNIDWDRMNELFDDGPEDFSIEGRRRIERELEDAEPTTDVEVDVTDLLDAIGEIIDKNEENDE